MRRALSSTPATIQTAQTVTLPAPVGGWNTRDGLANMPITDAIALDNFYPEATDVRPRPGSSTYASGITDQVETIFPYDNGTLLKFYVAAGNVISNIGTVATNGTVSGATVATGFSNSRFQHVQFGTQANRYIIAVNAADARQVFNGSIWDGSVSYNTNTTIAAFSNVEVFQRKLFYTELNSLRIAYHHINDAIGGTVGIAADLASYMKLGGSLQILTSWTRDGGSGEDDLLVAVSNKGEVAVFTGTDPASATTWALSGIFKIPPPLSPRSAENMGAELLIATQAGIVPMSGVVSGLVQQTPVTDKIRTSVNSAYTSFKANWGWELRYAAYLNMLILNVPVSTGGYQQQYVMNTQTMAWCRFKGWAANTFELHNGNLYFGNHGSVVKVDPTLTADDSTNIDVDARQAATALGYPGRLKQAKLFRPLLNVDGTVTLAADINFDFADTIPTNIPTPIPTSFAEWDVTAWDTAFWADDPSPAEFWQSAGGDGTYASVRLKGTVNGLQLRWAATDIVFEVGGVI